MNAITQSCVLFLWMHTFIFVRSQEIECTVPDIANGLVTGDIRVYKEHEILHYECNRFYKRTEGRSSKCTKVGTGAEWSPAPMCETIKCQLNLPPIEGTTYEPAGISLFSPTDELTVRCEKKFWIFNIRTTSVRTTCNEFGEWTITPICKEVICTKYDPLVTSWTKYWNQIKLDETTGYECVRKYKRPVGITEATCTRDGWSPNPLCQEIKCNRQPIENADFVNKRKVEYKYNERINYACKEGYEGNPSRICTETGWTGSSGCTAITCENCPEPVGCETPPFLTDGDLKYTVKSNYSNNERVEYMCQSFYTMEGESYRTCINGEWTGHMRCLKPCVVNEDDFRQHNITLKSSDNKYFTHDEIIEFRCARGTPVGAVAMRQRCNGGLVLLPTCQ